jgi:Ribbon-helix-helix protein, copG family
LALARFAPHGSPRSHTKVALFCYLDDELDEELRDHAIARDLPLSRVVRRAIRQHLAAPPPSCGCAGNPQVAEDDAR